MAQSKSRTYTRRAYRTEPSESWSHPTKSFDPLHFQLANWACCTEPIKARIWMRKNLVVKTWEFGYCPAAIKGIPVSHLATEVLDGAKVITASMILPCLNWRNVTRSLSPADLISGDLGGCL